MTRYWLDASSVIWCNRELLPLNGNKSYWDWLATKMEDGSVVTHKAVFDEIVRGADGEKPDPIAIWVKSRKGPWCSFGCTDESKALMGTISAYCWDRYGFEVAKGFLTGADALLIARASVDGGIVVTQESVQREPRIPSVCDRFNIQHMPLNKANIKLGMSLG